MERLPINKDVAHILKREIKNTLRQYKKQLDNDTCDLCCCELKALLEDNLPIIEDQPVNQQLEIALEFFQSVIKLKEQLPASCEALNLYALDVTDLLCKTVNDISQAEDEQVKSEAFAKILDFARAKGLGSQYDERFKLLEASLPLLNQTNTQELYAQVEALSKKVPATEENVAKYLLLKAQIEERVKGR